MERRGSNTWLIAALAIAVGFLAALLIFRGSDNNNTSATVGSTSATTVASGTTAGTTTPGTSTSGTTTTTTATANPGAPEDPQASVQSCVDLWNQPLNRGDHVFLLNVMTQQPIRVHVGETSDTPPKCEITVVTNGGTAYVFPAAGGNTYPYAQAPGPEDAKSLPAEQKISNALEQRDGTLAAR